MVDCPLCGSKAVRVTLISGYKFYCSRCGWNLEVARAALSFTTKLGLALAALGLIWALVVRVNNPGAGWSASAFVLAFSVLPIFYSLSALYQARKLKNVRVSSAAQTDRTFAIPEAGSPSDIPSKTIIFKEKEFSDLSALPRPRSLKMTWKGRVYFVVVVAAAGLYTAYFLPEVLRELGDLHSGHQSYWTLLAPAAVVYGYSFVFLRNRFRERQLLGNGELAPGYVTSQNDGHYTHSIQYSLKLADGNLIAGRCNDSSRSLYEGMTVPVFYDPDNPAHNIPLDCSLTKIG